MTYQSRRVLRAVGCMRWLAEQPLVVCMSADPEPYEPVRRFDREGTVASPDPSRPEAADLLDVKRRVPRVLLQTRVRLIGELLDLRW